MTMPERLKASPEDLAEAQKRGDESAHEHWKVEDGVIVFDGKGQNLCTDKDYGDFELLRRLEDQGEGRQRHLSPRHAADSNLGPVHQPRIRRRAKTKAPAASSTTRRIPKSRLAMADKPIGEWNTFWIKIVGDKVTVKLNGKLSSIT